MAVCKSVLTVLLYLFVTSLSRQNTTAGRFDIERSTLDDVPLQVCFCYRVYDLSSTNFTCVFILI